MSGTQGCGGRVQSENLILNHVKNMNKFCIFSLQIIPNALTEIAAVSLYSVSTDDSIQSLRCW